MTMRTKFYSQFPEPACRFTLASYMLVGVCVGLWVLLCLLLVAAGDDSPADHIRRSSELISQGNLAAAEKEANQALSTPSTQSLAYAALGAIRLKQKKYDEGEQLLRKAVKLNPDLVGARLNLGNVYLLQGKTQRASEIFRHVLKQDPQNVTARLSVAKIESENGRHSVSLDLLKPIAPTLRQTPDGLLLLATNYIGLHDEASAKSLVSDWKVLSPLDPNLSSSFAVLLAKNHLDEQAIEVLEELKKRGPFSYELAFNLANCYLKKADHQQASANYELALSYNENCIPCLLQLSHLADQEGSVEKALAYLIRAKRKDPDNPEVLFEFGKICLKKNLFQDATKALERAVELKPDRDSYVYVLASARVGTKRFEEARSLLEGLLKKKPDDAQLNYALGAVFYLEAKLDEAANYLERSILLQPDQVAAYYYLGSVAQNKGQNAKAIQLFQELLQRRPDHAASHEGLGAVLLNDGRYAEAAQHLEQAIGLNPNSARAHYQLGLLYARTGKPQEARQQLETFKKLQDQEKEEPQGLILLTPH
jgi:tetratricopeptide (TPR) repeat protein